MSSYRLTTLGTNTELLELPFDRPLAEWDDRRIVHVPRGISRHVVRFVEAGGEIFAIKEAPDRFVVREHRLLRELAESTVPVVDALRHGHWATAVHRADGDELGGSADHPAPAVLPALPLAVHRPVAAAPARPAAGRARRAVRAAAPGRLLLGRLLAVQHAVPPRRGRLAAYLVDAETGELHPTPHRRAARARPRPRAETTSPASCSTCRPPVTSTRRSTRSRPPRPAPRYTGLWRELTHDEIVPPGESYRINQRIRRLNDLGFDVSEMEISTEHGGRRLRFETHVVEPGHHQRRLFELTGLRVQENQARRPARRPGAVPGQVGRGRRPRRPRGPGRPALAGREVLRDARAGPARSCGASCPTRSCSTRSTSTAGSCRRPAATTSAAQAAVRVYVGQRAQVAAGHPGRSGRAADRGAAGADVRLA